MEQTETCFQAIQLKVSGFSLRTPKIFKTCFLNSCSRNQWTFEKRQIAYSAEEIDEQNPIEERKVCQIITRLEQKWELNGLEALDGLQMNTSSQVTTKRNS